MTRATQQPRGVTLLGATGSIGLNTLAPVFALGWLFLFKSSA